MSLFSCACRRTGSILASTRFIAPHLLFTILLVAGGWAKEQPLNAIVLYDTANGAAYEQVSDLLINGKIEVRMCTAGQQIDKSTYGRLPKITLTGATSLERTADGVLILTKDSAPNCVVPANVKFDRDVSYTASELADKAVLQGKTASGQGAPQLKPSVKLVFLAAPDTELAEYLKAERNGTIVAWQDFLSRYPNSTYATKGKSSLAALLAKDGEDHLAAYKKSLNGASPSFADLNTAKSRADQGIKLVPKDVHSSNLQDQVVAELTALNNRSLNNLVAYRDGLSAHKPGYRHLVAAQKLSAQILDIDSQFGPANNAQKSIAEEVQKYENALHSADALIKSQRPDDGFAAIVAYLAFAEEDSRVASIVRNACSYHLDRGRQAQSSGDWQKAVEEFDRAQHITATKEAEGLLKQAQAGLRDFQNRTAADKAIAESEEFENQKQHIEAYEVLTRLEPGPRALVTQRLLELEPAYISSASQRAKELQLAHTPIKGKVDEQGAQKAYDYLESASSLNEDDKNLKLRLDLLGETISDYYLQQAHKYLEKPLGSGVGLAWLYLDLAQQYKPNREDVKDERVKSSALYQMRSKLSIRVVFRDQTSRRDSPLFAEQLSDAIATGLETSGLFVKVIRSTDTTAAEPNFQLIGDVLQHRTVVNPTVEAARSKYRVNVREVTNENWTKANREDEAAMLDLQNVQRALDAAQARGKKKEIADAADAVTNAQKKVQDAHQKLDAIQKTTPSDVIEEYTYTKKTIDLDATVELAFRLVDANGNMLDTAPPIKRTTHKVFTVLENVKPEDTEGIRPQGAPPNELQFLTDIEIEGRDTLIKAVREKVELLPKKILEQARKKAADGDLDGAAESYILFLNSSSEALKTEREEAKRFLHEQFNVREVNLAAS